MQADPHAILTAATEAQRDLTATLTDLLVPAEAPLAVALDLAVHYAAVVARVLAAVPVGTAPHLRRVLFAHGHALSRLLPLLRPDPGMLEDARRLVRTEFRCLTAALA